MTTASDSRPQSRGGIDNSLAGAALVAIALLIVVAFVLYLWLQVSPPPALSSERYFPAIHGAALSYRLTNPDGSITYRSRNVFRDRANLLIGDLPIDAFTALFAAADLKLEELGAADALDRLSQFQMVRINDIESDAQGNPLTDTKSYSLVTADGLQQFAVNAIGIAPAIPLLPLSETPQTIQGNLNGTVPFRVTQQIKARGAYRTAIGEFADCIQVMGQLVVNETTTSNHTWYCAGVGEVADEFTDANGTRNTEIVAASVGELILGTTPVAGGRNLNAMVQRVFDDRVQGAPTRVLDYKEDTASRGITTNILSHRGNLLYGTASGAVVLLDRAAEQQLWRFQSGDAVFSTPIVADGLVYFGSSDKKAYALRERDGAFVWSFPTQDIVSVTPAVYGGTVYVASEDRRVYALDADTGRLRWSFASGGAFVAPPVIAGDTLYVSNDDGGLFALDPTTGNVRWEFSAGRAITAPVTSLNGILYFGSFDSKVFAVDQKSGALLWSQDVGNPVKQPVIVANGRVYVTMDDQLFALDAVTGNPIWLYDNNETLAGAPVLLGDQLWLASSGNLISIDAMTGTLTNKVPTIESTSTDTGVSSDGHELYLGFFDGNLLGFAGVTP